MSDIDAIREIEKTEFSDFSVYVLGLCTASACTSLTDEEASARINLEHPTGIDSSWEVSKEAFKTGEQNGTTCLDRPMTHRHLLFEC